MTAREHRIVNIFDAFGDSYAFYRGVTEGFVFNLGNALRKTYLFQIYAPFEGRCTYAFNTVGQIYFGYVFKSAERTF